MAESGVHVQQGNFYEEPCHVLVILRDEDILRDFQPRHDIIKDIQMTFLSGHAAIYRESICVCVV